MTQPPAVLAEYPSAAGFHWRTLGSAGGWSGATIWQGCSPASSFTATRPALCLKSWPIGYSADRLTQIHKWMQYARSVNGLTFVPGVHSNRRGSTVTKWDGTVWDLTSWMPGQADFLANPTPGRLSSAMAALVAVHRVWRPHVPEFAPCPGIVRRFEILSRFSLPGDLPPQLGEAVALLRPRIPVSQEQLKPWLRHPLPVQPCLCDVRHDHLLFTGEELTGLIDYGAVKRDHPAVDLARILSDLSESDESWFDRGLAAYRDCGGPVEIPERLVRVLAETGFVCAVIGWVERLMTASPDHAGFQRLQLLLPRLATIPV